MKKWYEELFQDYGEKYDKENFTRGTVGECDFIEAEIGRNKEVEDPGHRLRHRPPRHRAGQQRV